MYVYFKFTLKGCLLAFALYLSCTWSVWAFKLHCLDIFCYMRSLTKILFSWSTDTCWGMVRNGNIISSRDMHSFPLFWSGLSCFCVAFCFLFICLLFVSFVLSVSYVSGLFVPNLPFCFLYHLYRFISTYSIRSYHHYNLKVRLSLLAKPTRYIFVIYTGRIFLDT